MMKYRFRQPEILFGKFNFAAETASTQGRKSVAIQDKHPTCRRYNRPNDENRCHNSPTIRVVARAWRNSIGR